MYRVGAQESQINDLKLQLQKANETRETALVRHEHNSINISCACVKNVYKKIQ